MPYSENCPVDDFWLTGGYMLCYERDLKLSPQGPGLDTYDKS